MKYILIEVDFPKIGTRQFPFIFSDHMIHSEMLEAALYAVSKSIAVPSEIRTIGAGEISSMCFKGAHGKSATLRVESRGLVDDRAISMHDYTHGII